jgi:hypothetical protein
MIYMLVCTTGLLYVCLLAFILELQVSPCYLAGASSNICLAVDFFYILHFLISCIFSFKIEDLQIDRNFLVSVNLSVCLESSGDCVVSVPIFQNALLPKLLCKWDIDFITPSKNICVYVVYMSVYCYDFASVCIYGE